MRKALAVLIILQLGATSAQPSPCVQPITTPATAASPVFQEQALIASGVTFHSILRHRFYLTSALLRSFGYIWNRRSARVIRGIGAVAIILQSILNATPQAAGLPPGAASIETTAKPADPDARTVLNQFFKSKSWASFMDEPSEKSAADVQSLIARTLKDYPELSGALASFVNDWNALETSKHKKILDDWKALNEHYLQPLGLVGILSFRMDPASRQYRYASGVFAVDREETVPIPGMQEPARFFYGWRVDGSKFSERQPGWVSPYMGWVFIDLGQVDEFAKLWKNMDVTGLPFEIKGPLMSLRRSINEDALRRYRERMVRAHELAEMLFYAGLVRPDWKVDHTGIPDTDWAAMNPAFQSLVLLEADGYFTEIALSESPSAEMQVLTALDMVSAFSRPNPQSIHYWALRIVLNRMAKLPPKRWMNGTHPDSNMELLKQLANGRDALSPLAKEWLSERYSNDTLKTLYAPPATAPTMASAAPRIFSALPFLTGDWVSSSSHGMSLGSTDWATLIVIVAAAYALYGLWKPIRHRPLLRRVERYLQTLNLRRPRFDLDASRRFVMRAA